MRYRKTRKQKRKQKKVLIIGSLSLLLFLCVGYAAFSTNLNISAKGNIVNLNAAEQLRKKVVSSGDGLYVDTYDNERYVYKGMNPDNYILFNDELWRIVSIENDDTLKIILNSNIGRRQFDSTTYRNNENNTFCTAPNSYNSYYGCNVWGIIDGIYTVNGVSGTVTQNSSLNDYLNNEYYNSLNEDKKYIDNHVFFVGPRTTKYIDNIVTVVDNNTEEQQNAERKLTWQGKIGLINSSDFLKASSNKECNSHMGSRADSAPCNYENGNYLDNNKAESWALEGATTIGLSVNVSHDTFGAHFTHAVDGVISGGLSSGYSTSLYLVRPALYLIKDIKLEGDGTEDSPFLIKPYSA